MSTAARPAARGWSRSRAVVVRIGQVLSPLFLFLGYAIASTATQSQVAAVVVVMVLLAAVLPLFAVRFTRAGRQAMSRSATEDWLGTAAVGFMFLGLATAAFAILAVLLLDVGVGAVAPATQRGAEAVSVAYESLLWHLSDSVPFLKIPETLRWKPEAYLSGTGQGVLVLAYKAAVIVPVVHVATHLFASIVRDPEANDSAAAPSRKG